jgi:hypothetical protein
MLKAARVSVLILLLACSARAGYMQTGGSPEPPPPPSQPAFAVDEPTDAPEGPAAESVMRNDAPGALTQLALEVLAAMPSLF